MTVTIGRRELLAALGGAAAAWPLKARAQQPATAVGQARVGVLAASPPTPAMLNAFREGMRERGYIEGQNLSIDVRWPEGTFEQNPSVAAELVSANVEVIVAWSTPAVIAARRATSSMPIVMVSVERSGRFGVRRQSGATRWKYHRLERHHARSQCQDCGATRRACSRHQARRRREQCLQSECRGTTSGDRGRCS